MSSVRAALASALDALGDKIKALALRITPQGSGGAGPFRPK